MVYDESTARAILKKQCKVLSRRYDEIKVPPAHKSRKAWLKETLIDIHNYNILLSDNHVDRRSRIILALTPYNDNSGFYISCYILDPKKCDISVNALAIYFSNHVLVRFIQTFKTQNLSEISGVFLAIIEATFAVKVDFEKDGHFDLYVKELGLVPIVVDKGRITIKTLVPEDVLGVKQKINYKKSPILLDTTNK